MHTNPDPETDRGLIRLIKVSSSLSLAVMAAILVSIREVTPELKFQFSFWTVVAFAVSLVFSWLFWRLVFQPEELSLPGSPPPRSQKRRAVQFSILSAILCLATMTAFGLSLKGVGNQGIREILQGAALAVLALAFLGFVVWRIAHFLESDQQKDQDKDHPPDPSHDP